jgi:hypothetical protein
MAFNKFARIESQVHNQVQPYQMEKCPPKAAGLKSLYPSTVSLVEDLDSQLEAENRWDPHHVMAQEEIFTMSRKFNTQQE